MVGTHSSAKIASDVAGSDACSVSVLTHLISGTLATPNRPMHVSHTRNSSGARPGYVFANHPPANDPRPSPNMNSETITVIDSMFTPNAANITRCQTIW